ncbi:uncharacterized protein JN550_003595 [Neoarthrinium moseri]|uniref:uncharacterized protein n=1 Tax=Neoarthrinium moseri TaxID=1658444 RepID=UPI001FDADE2D|nr:uncharacterized protein JN550_003595 [Neoarthrinium moseri]KAI1872721.1 hypothetical protein JN550_003595 [Neoarthrinium moseri]
MAEILGITSATLGLLPIIIEGIHGYKWLRKTIAVVRNPIKELRPLKTVLRVQETIFLNEWELVLRSITKDERQARHMISDPDHAGWRDYDLASALTISLDKSYEVFVELAKETQVTQNELKQVLSCFSLQGQKKPGESVELAIKRLSLGFKINELERKVQRLRQHNEDLQALRTQIQHLREPVLEKKHKRKLPLPHSVIHAVREAQEIASEAYNALNNCFSCKRENHEMHWAALCTDSTFEQCHNLEMVLLYAEVNQGSNNQQAWTLAMKSNNWTFGFNSHQDRVAKQRPGTAKQLRFADDLESASQNITKSDTSQANSSQDLGLIDDICYYLEKKCLFGVGNGSMLGSFGHLRCPHSGYVFHVSPCEASLQTGGTEMHEGISLQDLLRATQERPATPKFKLTWALKLALTVLQYHSTPWLHDDWRTSDLYTSNKLQTTSKPKVFLRTLLATGTAKKASASNTEQCFAGPINPETQHYLLTSDDLYGIYNRALWALGTAFLEIWHWKPLSDMAKAADAGNEILTARRVAKSRTELGEPIHRMTQMCLQCNFGCEPDLNSSELQVSFYNEVVCLLQDQLKALESFGL